VADRQSPVAPSNNLALFPSSILDAGRATLAHLRDRAETCQKCPLYLAATSLVFGAGPDHPLIAFVGEGPGENEDRQGEPFVGRSGRLLENMLAAIGLTRNQVFITNAVLHRAPENRAPEKAEIEACAEFLVGQLRAVRPRLLVALGKTAATALLGKEKKLEEWRGRWHVWEGVPLRVTYHPARLLREPALKKEAWADMLALKACLDVLGTG